MPLLRSGLRGPQSLCSRPSIYTVPNPHLEAARALRPLVDENARRAGMDPVPDATIEALQGAGLYGVLSPRDVGGAELSVLEALDVFAEVSRADGSAGWCLMASATLVAYFGSYAEQSFVDRMFGSGIPLAAGQFAPNGTGVPDGDDFVISGRYQFGSGIHRASWVGAGVMVTPPAGDAELRFMCFPISEVEVQGNWEVLGLQATASYDYEVKDLRVPRAGTFPFFGPTRRRGGPIYELGVLPMTAIGHAGFAIGVSRRALDELISIARSKHRMGAPSPLRESDQFLNALGTLESRLRAAVAWTRECFGRLEQTLLETGALDPVQANSARQATAYVTREGAEVVRGAYLLAGTDALREGVLARCFRDIHAGTQHFFAGSSATLDLARDLLAASPENSVDA